MELSHLKLETFNEDYVKTLWEDGFSSDDTCVPREYHLYLQTIPLKTIIQSIAKELRSSFLTGTPETWDCLMKSGFDLKRILCLLHHLFVIGKKHQDQANLENALVGVRLYFAMLSIPDCHVFSVFHCNLYDKAMNLMLTVSPMHPLPVAQRKDSRRIDRDSANSEISSNLLSLIGNPLRDLLISLKGGNFCQSNDALRLTVNMLSSLAQVETKRELELFSFVGKITDQPIENLSLGAFCGLYFVMCHPSFGDVSKSSCIVMKLVFKMIHQTFEKDSTSKEGNIIRKNALNFVYFIVEKLGNACHESVAILLQYLSVYCPERAEPRYKLVDNVYSLIENFQERFFISTVCLFVDLSYMEKTVALSLFAIDVLGKLLMLSEDSTAHRIRSFVKESNIPDYVFHLHDLCFIAVLTRIQDASALVTARALFVFSNYLEAASSNALIQKRITSMFISPYQNVQNVFEVPRRPFKDIEKISQMFKRNSYLNEDMLPCGRTVVEELLECVGNDKVVVRKSALQCIVRVLCTNKKFVSQEVLQDIGCYCHDSGVYIRKAMVRELTDLLLCYPSHDQLQKEWVRNVLPLMVDPESKVVDEVAQNLARVFLENMVEERLTISERQGLPWLLSSLLSDFQLRKFFLKACCKWVDKELRLTKLLSIIKSHIGMRKPYNTAAWLMLMCVAEILPIKDSAFVLDFYHKEVQNIQNVSAYLSLLVMEVLWFTWKHLPQAEKQNLEKELNMDLILFKMPVPLIPRAMDIRHMLYQEHKNLPDDSKTLSELPEWAEKIIKVSERGILEMFQVSPDVIEDEDIMQRYIISLGCAVLYCPGVIKTSTIHHLENMLIPPTDGNESLWMGDCTTQMKAALIVTLGKLSLQNEKRARNLVKLLEQLLNETDESALKNNVMACLTDLCIRYASLVDGLLPEICVCLKDSQSSVRENTLVLLIQLLQEDYLKMKEKLFFNLLTMLNDDDSTIRAMTRTFFVDTVLHKNKKIFCSHFTFAVFHYNGYKNHHRYSEIFLTNQEEKVFNLRGSDNIEFRQKIYRFVLSHLEEESRSTVSQMLCIDVCKGVVEGTVLLNEAGIGVLEDTLFAMNCEEMTRADKKDGDDDAQLDADDMANQVISVRKAVLSEMMKKHVIEVEVPTLAKLYQKLCPLLPHLAKYVMKRLKFVVAEEKLVLEEILKKNDLDMLKQLEYGLQHANRRDSGQSDGSYGSESDEESEVVVKLHDTLDSGISLLSLSSVHF